MKKLIFGIILLYNSNNFAYKCEALILNPKNKETQKIPFNIGDRKDFGFKTFEYQCSIATTKETQNNLKLIDLTCIVPNTKLVVVTSAIVGMDFPVPANLYLKDRNGNERKLVVTCKK